MNRPEIRKSAAVSMTIRTIIRLTLLLALLTTASAFLASCGVDDIDIGGYEDEQIILSGLIGKVPNGSPDKSTDGAVNITVRELKELECVTEETESTSDKIGSVRATGPLLSTLADALGADLADFSRVVVHGQDDYEITLDREFLGENRVILAFGMDGEPLAEDARPMRIIIPESDSAYWVRMVTEIEFVK